MSGNESEGNMADASIHPTIICSVKWFDPVKGFGFVIPENGGTDILLHASALIKSGRSTIADGVLMEVEVVQVRARWQVSSVKRILSCGSQDLPRLEQLEALDRAELSLLPLEPARVKWFDKAKGIGFANSFGSREDIFIHIEVLRMSGLVSLKSSEAILLRTIEGERGRMAVEVADWYQLTT